MAKSIKTGNEKLGKTIFQRLEILDEITRRNIENLTKLTISNVIDASIVQSFAVLVNSKKSQLSLTHFDEKWFTIKSHNPKNVERKEKNVLLSMTVILY